MIAGLAFLILGFPNDPTATRHASDAVPLIDQMRPVSRISRDGFTLQYWTQVPCETQVEIRRGDLPRVAYGHKPDGTATIKKGNPLKTSWHRIELHDLEPGKRYFYRLWDPGAVPTATETAWGAGEGWRREFAVSTQAQKGWKTIVRIPVKVLLMPNVVNVESAYVDPEVPAPPPAKLTKEEIDKIKSEYAVSARELWVSSGMRLWIDYQIVVDDRLQRWGPEPAMAQDTYKGLPVCRSYPGKDFEAPGGGTWTFVDMKDPMRVVTTPFVEERPYSGQIEQAFPRKWNQRTKKWDFYNSGGGTFGVDGFPQGIPGRSQFLGGGDTAWLATHEFHHDLESHGEFSLSNREDDRIVFDHPTPRRRVIHSDGSVEEVTWTTNGRHGEHWDLIAYWDRLITDAQWLRMYFGYTETVRDADEDGFPDDDPRLPLDEKRFGTLKNKKQTDGHTGDLAKAMLSNWIPGPLQSTWIKPPFQSVRPDPATPDADGDGLLDVDDPYPLFPNAPFISVLSPKIDGDPEEWKNVPEAGSFSRGGIRFVFKQAHDEFGYYGLYEVHGPWSRIDGTFDGEGEGVYSGKGVLGFQTLSNATAPGAASPAGPLVETRPSFGGAPGLKIGAKRTADDGMTIEFRLPNRGEGPWYWTRGGQEIGVAINVWDRENRGYSLWEPYHLFYARMLEPYGREELPSNPPPRLVVGPGVQVIKPGDASLKLEGGWRVEDGAWRHTGDESPLYLANLKVTDFDLAAIVEAKSDVILGGFTKANKLNAAEGYIGFVGGYSNTVTRLRIFGNERGDSNLVMTPGRHEVQLTRRGGELWLLVDGKPAVYATDPNPKAVLDRLGLLGGYGGDQKVYEIRIKV
ncbi:hypothetical protein [Fimbriimonas ginsengisoli]|uniref:Uncharacterized protein n=1 Tax=Fimbriimonas ginsengisoli Gsoil 348 TaxID=661478 RepID=A0A068NPP2_FIMGI|nr:hypothetical protein [Fimbriimonas ginsengisoli]AIE85347.1 hypothetical protein OP10G_1979 [Fimbriimonas ginsengisoli Gsoil 348]